MLLPEKGISRRQHCGTSGGNYAGVSGKYCKLIFCFNVKLPLKKLDGPIHEIFSITYQNVPNGLELLKSQLAMRNIVIHHIQMEKNPDDTVTVTLNVSRANAITCTDLAGIFANDPSVKNFRL